MSESKAASVVFTNSSYLAGQAQTTAEKAQSAAGNAYKLANDAQKTADGKNSIYRGTDPNTVPTAGLKEGDLYFTDNALYTWNGSAWEETVSDTTGAEIKAQVEKAIDEAKKLAIEAQTTADGKNKIYRGNSIEDAPKSGVVVGDLFFSSNDLYRYDDTSWEQVVSDTTGAETHAEVEKATSEVKAYSDSVKAQLEADAAKAQATADSITNYVQNSSGSSYLATLLNQSPSNASLSALVNGQVVSAINVSSSGDTLIAGKKIMLDGDVTIDGTAFASKLKATGITVDQLVAGSIDASKIKVINLDANSITTGSLSAAVIRASGFNNYTVSPSNTWNFDDTKSAYGNWFLTGETTADHVYNGPKDANNNKLTPFMYVTSRGNPDGNRFTVTVWKDNDPTQYQRTWDGNHWSDWVILPNSQNIVSAINLSPDSVMIAGKKIMLDGDVAINGTAFASKLKATGVTVDQLVAGKIDASKIDVINLNANNITTGTLNGITINGSTFNGGKFVSSSYNTTVNNTIFDSYKVLLDGNGLEIDSVEKGNGQTALLASRELYLGSTNTGNRYIHAMTAEFIGNPTIFINNGSDSTVLSSDGITSNSVHAGNFMLTGHKMRATDNNSLYVTNSAGNNFDGTGNVGFQVWNGIGLGASTIYTPGTDLYVQQGNVGPAFNQSYSSAAKTEIHCKTVTTQVANTVTSQLSVKTAITKVDYDRALMAIQNTDMYDYRYISDDSDQHYVSGIIDDVHASPEYKMDDMLINKERTARIDANLLGYHHVVLQKLLERVDALEHQINKA